MTGILKRAYPVSDEPLKTLGISIGIGVFVFLFLWIFRPFSIGGYPGSIFYLSMGFGGITLLVELILFFVVKRVFSPIFDENKWTVGKEILWVLLIVVTISVANTAYTSWIGIGGFSLGQVILFLFYTLSVAIFPVSVITITNQGRLNRKYRLSSEQLNAGLAVHPLNLEINGGSLRLNSENKDEFLDLRINDLLFIESADNYITVHFIEKGQAGKMTLRNTLSNAAAELDGYSAVMRCHRSYIVNLDKVRKVSGNAQGLKLHLDEVAEPVPVSRALTAEVRKLLS